MKNQRSKVYYSHDTKSSKWFLEEILKVTFERYK